MVCKQKPFGPVRAVVSRILFIGVSVQILLGLLWMWVSFDNVQSFGETVGYLEVSESLLWDEYTGILYPLLLRLIRSLAGIPWEPVLCLLQLCAAFWAGYCFVGAAGVQKPLWKVWGSLALAAFPMSMQCHMAILPDSLAYSCFLMMLAGVVGTVRTSAKGCDARRLAWIYLCWLLAALFLPEYLYFGAVPTACFLIWEIRKQRKSGDRGSLRRLGSHFLIAAVFLGLILSVNALTQVEGSRGKVHASWEAAWFRRTAWTSLAPYYPHWPQEVKDALSDEELGMAINAPEKMKTLLQPRVEQALGEEAAREWFGEFAALAYGKNYPNIHSEMLTDAAAYLFPPVAAQMFLEGRGYASYCCRNYEIMREAHPRLTAYYMSYSAWWFTNGVVLAALAALLCCGEKTGQKPAVFPIFICVVTAGGMIAWYTLQEAGLWDYKKALLVGGLWMTGMALGAYCGGDQCPQRAVSDEKGIREETGCVEE